jgi:hypothetical protein
LREADPFHSTDVVAVTHDLLHRAGTSNHQLCTAGQRTRAHAKVAQTANAPPLLDRTFWTVWRGRDRPSSTESDSGDIYRACGPPDRRHSRKSSSELLPSATRSVLPVHEKQHPPPTLFFLASGGTGMGNSLQPLQPCARAPCEKITAATTSKAS